MRNLVDEKDNCSPQNNDRTTKNKNCGVNSRLSTVDRKTNCLNWCYHDLNSDFKECVYQITIKIECSNYSVHSVDGTFLESPALIIQQSMRDGD